MNWIWQHATWLFDGVGGLVLVGVVGWLIKRFLNPEPVSVKGAVTASAIHGNASVSGSPVASGSHSTPISNIPSPSTAAPIGVVPVATESAPIILDSDNPIRTVRVGVGDYREFVCEGITVRITVKQIVTSDPKKPLALLHVHAGGENSLWQ